MKIGEIVAIGIFLIATYGIGVGVAGTNDVVIASTHSGPRLIYAGASYDITNNTTQIYTLYYNQQDYRYLKTVVTDANGNIQESPFWSRRKSANSLPWSDYVEYAGQMVAPVAVQIFSCTDIGCSTSILSSEINNLSIVTPGPSPSAPSLNVTIGNGSLTANWTPANDGALLFAYYIQVDTNSGKDLIYIGYADTGTTSLTFTGLNNGQEYRIQVVSFAETAKDSSAFSTIAIQYGTPSGGVSISKD